MPAVLAAAEGDRLGSMFVFFLIALVIVAPFGYQRIRGVLRERRGSIPSVDDAAKATSGEGSVPGDVAAGDDLSRVIAAITRVAGELAADPSEFREVDVPASPLVEGRAASAAVVDALIGDAVRRLGLSSAWVDADGRRVLRLMRHDTP